MGTHKSILNFIALGLLAVLCGCNISIGNRGSAEGYGGGDDDVRKVENARLVAASLLRQMKEGEVADPICDIPICVGSQCALLNALSSAQRNFLAGLLVDADYSTALIGLLENSETFSLIDEPIVLGGVVVDARAELRGTHVALNRERVRARNESELISLVVHEVMHLAAFPEDADGILTDEEAIEVGGATLFASGRVLANLAGACVQGHEERERILGSVGRRVNVDGSRAPVLPTGEELQNLPSAVPSLQESTPPIQQPAQQTSQQITQQTPPQIQQNSSGTLTVTRPPIDTSKLPPPPPSAQLPANIPLPGPRPPIQFKPPFSLPK